MAHPPRPIVVLAEPLYHPIGEEILREHCELRVLKSPSHDALLDACRDAHAIALRYPHRADEELFNAAPKLSLVAASGRGTDSIDIEGATKCGVVVTNNPGFGERPVSEAAIALILTLAKQIVPSNRWMREGTGWAHRYSFENFVEVQGRTLGIVGFGSIGSETARKARAAFDMRVLAYDPYVPDETMRSADVEPMDDLHALLAEADFVSMHPELNDETRGMIGEPELRAMKPTAFLINTARGKVVQEAPLVRALQENWISGAALDVYEDEPVGDGSPLFQFENLILTPHVAGLTDATVREMSRETALKILSALSGTPPAAILNPAVWETALKRIGGGFTIEIEPPA